MIFICLLYILPLTLGEDQCCPSKEVLDGSSKVVYNFKEKRQNISGQGCQDGCIYSKGGEDYCFGSGGDSPVECRATSHPDMEPKKAEIIEIKHHTKITRNKENLLVKKMHIKENGLYSFTQTTTYNPILKLLKISVPSHGFGLDKVAGSINYLLQTGKNDEIFDTEINIVGNKSSIRNVSIEMKPIIDVLKRKLTSDVGKIETKHSESIISHSEKIDGTRRSSTLPTIVQELTKGTELFRIKKIPISERKRKFIMLGGIHFSNETTIPDSQPIVRQGTTKHKRRQKRSDYTQACHGYEKIAHLDQLQGADRICYYMLKIGDDKWGKVAKVAVDHQSQLDATSTSCCDDNKGVFAFPYPCHCRSLFSTDAAGDYTDGPFKLCAAYYKWHTSDNCCQTVTYKKKTYVRRGLIGITEDNKNYGCQDQCLYESGGEYRCFKENEGVVTRCPGQG